MVDVDGKQDRGVPATGETANDRSIQCVAHVTAVISIGDVCTVTDVPHDASEEQANACIEHQAEIVDMVQVIAASLPGLLRVRMREGPRCGLEITVLSTDVRFDGIFVRQEAAKPGDSVRPPMRTRHGSEADMAP